MSLVAAKCPNCGANIEVEMDSKAGICKYCGTAFITQEAIVNFNNTIVNNITNNIGTQNVTVSNGDFESIMKTAMESMEIEDYKSALNHFTKASELNPDDVECKIYKNICSSWMGTPSGAISIFEKVYLKEGNNNKEKIKSHLVAFNNLIVSYQRQATKRYDPDYPNESLVNQINNELMECAHAYLVMIDIIDKYNLSDKEYLFVFKNYSICLNALLEKKKWCTHATGGLIDYKTIIIDDVEEIIKDKNENDERIKKIDPSYTPREVKTGGCYIATCVYGSYDCPEVWTLRRYRDDTLGTTWYGRIFIRSYYAISPTLVKWFGDKKWFKEMWQAKLDRMVLRLKTKGVEDTPYLDKNW